MVNFRKMREDDLDKVYQNSDLRSLITVPPKGEKFAVIIIEEDLIIGGVSGYVDNNFAFIQCLIITNSDQCEAYKDGLIRSLIHILELDGVTYLFTQENAKLYYNIGFQNFIRDNWKDGELGTIIQDDILSNNVLWINLKEFFI